MIIRPYRVEMAREKGYLSSLRYIGKANLASLNEFNKVGFKITAIVQEYKLLGKVWGAF